MYFSVPYYRILQFILRRSLIISYPILLILHCIWIYIYIPRSSFVALFSGRLGCWLLFEIWVRKSSSSPKRLLLQFTYDFPGFISCCITMLRIQPHSILCQLNSLMWAIEKTKWSNDKWPANRQGQPPPTLYPP